MEVIWQSEARDVDPGALIPYVFSPMLHQPRTVSLAW
jgi:hypothetical protein